MKAQFLVVTPEMARRWLSKRHPRQVERFSTQVAAGFAQQMQAGHWDERHSQGITISATGLLLDGQHRLEALVMYGQPLTMLVVDGADDAIYGHIDAHFPRSLAFRAARDKDHMAVLSSLIRLARYGSDKVRPTIEDVTMADDFCQTEYANFRNRLSAARRARINPAFLRTAVVLRMKQHEEFVDAICAAYSAYMITDLKGAPRSMSVLYRRMTETHNPPLLVFAIAWKAFDPNRFEDSRIQINSLSELIKEVQRDVLYPLTMALAPARVEFLQERDNTADRKRTPYDRPSAQSTP